MGSSEEDVRNAQVADAGARNISHNVRCTECGSQSIEDSQADIAVLLRKLIRDEIKAGKTERFLRSWRMTSGKLYFTPQSLTYRPLRCGCLRSLLVAAVGGGVWAFNKHKQRTNVHIMALDHIGGVLLTLKERVIMLDLLTPPPKQGTTLASWWKR